MEIELGLRWRVGARQVEEMVEDVVALLDATAVGGNLGSAARDIGVSYRHAWGLVKHWESRLGQTLIALERGRGATLTPAGEALRATWHRTAERLAATLADAAAQAQRALDPHFGRREEGPLRIAASHGFGLGVLADLMRGQGVEIDLNVVGSEAALAMYASGSARVAGFHVPHGRIGERLLGRFRPLLDGRRDALLLVETRELGFMTQRGTACASVAEIARRKLRFLNRQAGSGSRLVFDLMLADAGLKATDVRGYHDEEYTHLAVAAVIAGGAADVGLGAQTAAAKFALDFTPVVRENYLLVLLRQKIEHRPFSLLRKTLSSQAYKRALAAIPGCDPRGSGRVIEVKQLAAPVKTATRAGL